MKSSRCFRHFACLTRVVQELRHKRMLEDKEEASQRRARSRGVVYDVTNSTHSAPFPRAVMTFAEHVGRSLTRPLMRTQAQLETEAHTLQLAPVNFLVTALPLPHHLPLPRKSCRSATV